MHVPRTERAARWRAAAQQDYDLGSEIVDRYPHLACYHAQQSSEKALKACITLVHGDAIPTHLARVLLNALDDLRIEVPDGIVDDALALDAYYMGTRYPDALDFADASLTYTPTEARRALERAWRVLHFVDELGPAESAT